MFYIIIYNMQFYGLHDLDKKMLKYINYKNGVFIEVGANDGLTQSNTAYFEKNLNWTGLLIEPNNEQFLKCKENRKNSIVENYALVSKNYKEECVIGNFTNQKANGLMSMTLDLGDYTEDHMLKQKNAILSEQLVKCRSITLTKLLDKHNFDKIDFFSLDVEGYEISVLNGLDFNKYRPKYILIETANREIYQNKIKEYMKEKNYIFLERLSLNDDLFINKNI